MQMWKNGVQGLLKDLLKLSIGFILVALVVAVMWGAVSLFITPVGQNIIILTLFGMVVFGLVLLCYGVGTALLENSDKMKTLGKLLCWLWIHQYSDSTECAKLTGWASCTRCGDVEWRC